MTHPQTILLAGASRGLGLGLAETFATHGWQVTAAARNLAEAPKLAAAAAAHQGRITTATLDITSPASIQILAASLPPASLDILFIVAGRLGHWSTPLADISVEDITAEFVTNATSPVICAEALLPALKPTGTLVLMTSILGSIAGNTRGGIDLYRASKAALNMLTKCLAIRHPDRPIILMHPGWVRTDMGGPNADIDLQTSVTGMHHVLTTRPPTPGLAYLDYLGHPIPW